MKPPLRVAVIGAGFWSNFQVAGWYEIGGAELVGISNRTVAKAKAIGQRYGAPAFASPEEMLDSVQADVVDIITDVDTHPVYTQLAIDRGLAVICQKPMAPTMAQARQMVRAAESAKVPLFIHENWRFQAPLIRVGEILSSGEIGEPFRARIDFCSAFPVFDNQPFLATLDHFILSDLGSHILDVARAFFGEAESLYCRTQRVNPTIKGEDVATTVMTMTGCPLVTCNISYASRLEHESFPQTSVLIEGSKGSTSLGLDYRIATTTASGTRVETVTSPRYAWADPAYDLIHASIAACNLALREALVNNTPSGVEGASNLKTVELVFGSYKSAKTGSILSTADLASLE